MLGKRPFRIVPFLQNLHFFCCREHRELINCHVRLLTNMAQELLKMGYKPAHRFSTKQIRVVFQVASHALLVIPHSHGDIEERAGLIGLQRG